METGWTRSFGAQDLATLQRETSALAYMSRQRDAYTAMHQESVAGLCVAVATALDLPVQRLEVLRLAALVHDIGKIAVPAELLSKPGRLGQAEYQMVKEHSRVGAEILARLESRCPIAEIVHQHHERLDGSGYPRGLRRDAILIESRIMAVADVFDAMTAHRPYRPALSLSDALAQLEQGRGTLFEADIVDVLTDIVTSTAAEAPVTGTLVE